MTSIYATTVSEHIERNWEVKDLQAFTIHSKRRLEVAFGLLATQIARENGTEAYLSRSSIPHCEAEARLIT